MTHKVAALPGGGIGPEVLNGGLELLEITGKKYNFIYNLKSYDSGGATIDTHDTPPPNETLSACQEVDAISLGAVGGPKWTDPNNRPEQGLSTLRKELGLFANARPVKAIEGTSQFSPLKGARAKHTDLAIARELTSGIYFGEPRHINHSEALDSPTYIKAEIERIAKVVFELARTRNRKVTSVDKENVPTSSKLWRRTVTEVNRSYPDIELNHLLVDACSMHLIIYPSQFDATVTENLFGDILNDEASVISGSLGLSPSAGFNEHGTRLYEPIHGSAPDIANQSLANLFGMVLSLAMCLRESLNQSTAAEELEDAAYHLIKTGKTTKDLEGRYRTSEIFELLKRSYQ